MKPISLMLAAALLVSAGSVLAADDASGGRPQGPRGACKADAQKLCPGIKPGGGRIAACLKEHRDDVSPGCMENLKKMHPKASANKQ